MQEQWPMFTAMHGFASAMMLEETSQLVNHHSTAFSKTTNMFLLRVTCCFSTAVSARSEVPTSDLLLSNIFFKFQSQHSLKLCHFHANCPISWVGFSKKCHRTLQTWNKTSTKWLIVSKCVAHDWVKLFDVTATVVPVNSNAWIASMPTTTAPTFVHDNTCMIFSRDSKAEMSTPWWIRTSTPPTCLECCFDNKLFLMLHCCCNPWTQNKHTAWMLGGCDERAATDAWAARDAQQVACQSSQWIDKKHRARIGKVHGLMMQQPWHCSCRKNAVSLISTNTGQRCVQSSPHTWLHPPTWVTWQFHRLVVHDCKWLV